MSIIIKLFLLAYLFVMVLVSILSIAWVMSLIFAPEWVTRRLRLKH